MKADRRPLASLMLATFFAASCGDTPTAVVRGPDTEPMRSASKGANLGGRSFEHGCVLSARTPGGTNRYRYYRMDLSFPRSAQAAHGGTRDRSYRWLAPDGEILSIAHCRIPSTPNATDMLDRRLGLKAPRRRQGSSGGGDTQECGTAADPCTLYSVSTTSGTYWGEPTSPPADDGCADDWYGLCEQSSSDFGGGTEYDPYENGGCDPALDPNCEKPLTEGDVSTIRNAVDTYIRMSDEIVDKDNARAQCKAMYDQFVKMLIADPPLVYRGAYTTQKGDAGVDPHTGAYNPETGHFHFEPNLLDSAATGDLKALREIANTAMHEAAHALGFDHGEIYSSPFGPLYTEDYFNKLDGGEDSCMK